MFTFTVGIVVGVFTAPFWKEAYVAAKRLFDDTFR